MLILGIETSCDETAIAIIDSKNNAVRANIVYSQFEEHAKYGGVVPEIAARAHAEYLPALLQKALVEANCALSDLGAIAAATGPGLVGALLMGSTFGKTLALGLGVPFLPTNHIEAHALTACLTEENLSFPYLLLLVSGGHCQLVDVRDVGDYTTLGTTLDDAVGECFDKVGKVLNLEHPSGPKVEKWAKKAEKDPKICKKVQKSSKKVPSVPFFPTPRTKNPLDFSFSGLKTSVINFIRNYEQKSPLPDDMRAEVCAAFQTTVAKILSKKVALALAETQATNIVISGGVACNQEIRTAVRAAAEKSGAKFYAPPIELCTDNAVMIAYTAGLRLHAGQAGDLAFRVRPRWPLEEMSL